jgi:hypothetical protein
MQAFHNISNTIEGKHVGKQMAPAENRKPKYLINFKILFYKGERERETFGMSALAITSK